MECIAYFSPCDKESQQILFHSSLSREDLLNGSLYLGNDITAGTDPKTNTVEIVIPITTKQVDMRVTL